MPYQQYTLGSLTSDIQSLISDTSGVYWTAPEIHYGIWEFMREWSAMTGYWRQRVQCQLPIGPSNPWIDLSVYFPVQRPRTVTVDSICREIQYHLCEPPNGITGSGMTIQFSIDSIIAAIVRARNQFTLDVQFPLSITQNFPVAAPGSGRFYLPEVTQILNRAYWTAQGYTTILQRSDSFAEDSYAPDWTVNPSGRPACYSIAESRPTEVAIFPNSFDSGILEYLSVNSTPLSPLDGTTSLAIPDDYAPAIKYLAMSDLFSLDGETYDAYRSVYCQKRYDNYISTAKIQNTVLRAYLNGIPAILGTLSSLDSKFPFWRSQTGHPFNSAVISEIVVFFPLANNVYSGALDICTSAPIPLTDSDFINLSPGEIDCLTGFVQHYLSIKAGGAELAGTLSQYDYMQTMAAKRNSMLNADSRYLSGLFRQPNFEIAQLPDLVSLNA